MPIDPFTIAAIAKTVVDVGSKIIKDRKIQKQTEELQVQRDADLKKNKQLSEQGLNVVRGMTREGDPTLQSKIRAIEEEGASAIGKITGAAGSTQEIINAVQQVQKGKTAAKMGAEAQAGQFKLGTRRMLADAFGRAGQLRLLGEQIIDQRTANALAAIHGAGQADVQSTQATTGNILDIMNYQNMLGQMQQGGGMNMQQLGSSALGSAVG